MDVSRTDIHSFEPSTYFGLWSAAKYAEVITLLARLGARYWSHADRFPEEHLREWEAWDPTAQDPFVGIDLWIHSDDQSLVGYSIVERFPERKFGWGD